MITFFTTPKAFQGHIGIIQTNALSSWTFLSPRPEVLVLGNDEGGAETAEKFGFKHFSLKQSIGETPLLSDIFHTAREQASFPYLCFINADIILLDDFMIAFERVRQKFEKFLMISSRWNLDVDSHVALDTAQQRTHLRNQALQKHDMYPAGGSDFFVFHRDMYQNPPPFLLGRGYWDNWLIYKARQEKIKVIDVTSDVIAVHQNHDYSHVQGIQPGNRDADLVFKAQQGRKNLLLAGGQGNIYTNYDANYILVKNRLKKVCFFSYRRLKSTLRRLKLYLLSR